jgi:hypothetical protein
MFGKTLGKIDKILIPMLLFELTTSANVEILLVELKVHHIEMPASHDELKYEKRENSYKNIQIIRLNIVLNHKKAFLCNLDQGLNHLINFVIGLTQPLFHMIQL